jgi:hypothetical protein
MHKTLKIQVAAGIIILISVVLGTSFWAMSESVDTTPVFVKIGKKQQEQFCTQEAMECPDGSYVGRSGSKCEFAECPSIKKSECIKEGKNIGAVRPGEAAEECCPGLVPVMPGNIEGMRGVCLKIEK